MPELTPEQVKGFPDNPRAKIITKGGMLYVVEYTYFRNAEGKPRNNRVTLGKIVDGTYYSMEDYRAKFKRDGTLRSETPEPKRQNRVYVRRKPVSEIVRKVKPQPEGYPKASEVKNFPDNPRARIIRIAQVFYVCESTYYRQDGKPHEKRTYLGRIVDNVFYTTEEYKEKFDRQGNLRERKLKKGKA